ncbi:MAG: hypothetical protein DRN20_05160, partial [Thermoplasmata archaeon]
HQRCDVDGYATALLPAGDYEIDIAYNTKEYGVSVEYKATVNLSVSRDMSKTIKLELVKRYGIEVQSPDEVFSVYPGDTVTTKITVRNQGNTEETIRLEGTPNDWGFEFEKNNITLDFGESVTINVTITVSKDALVSQNKAEIKAVCVEDNAVEAKAEVSFNISRVFGVGVEEGSVRRIEIKSGELKYSINVKNLGNDADNFDITVVNAQTWNALGWNVSVTDDDGNVIKNVEIDGKSSKAIYITIKKTGERIKGMPSTVEIYVVSQNSSASATYDLAVVRPDVGIEGEILVEGNNIRTTPPSNEEFYVFLVSSVIITLAIISLLVLGTTRPRRRRRWQRR